MLRKLFQTIICLLLLYCLTSEAKCRTKSPPQGELEAAQKRIRRFQAKRSSRTCTQCITIETYFWVFQPTANFNSQGDPIFTVDEAKAREQFDVLVERFRDTPFTFNLAGVQIITNNQYYQKFDGLEETIGGQYRRGGWDTLNCYFGGANEGSFAFFPPLTSVENYGTVNAIDGAWNDISTMPGVDPDLGACCRLGITTVHEVGHW